MPRKKAAKKKATELEFLQYFYSNADFGPASDDVIDMIKDNFKAETGKALPDGYVREE